MCGGSDCLLINPKGTIEGEITCAVCDSDFDGTSGCDKYGRGSRGELIPFVPENANPGEQSGVFPSF